MSVKLSSKIIGGGFPLIFKSIMLLTFYLSVSVDDKRLKILVESAVSFQGRRINIYPLRLTKILRSTTNRSVVTNLDSLTEKSC
jgi:hypothetical protein